ncbi:MAG: SUMF1/EgtB/PvdO family nonheme iron enzyme [Deltaproteobacteria bacterium]|nr:SUMF1/EgtB/PvdO family nonheme iron enzyme [Deltaproteobacteria bacterium]
MPFLAPGSQLTDVLTLVRVLGEGGMGTVWLAEHRALGTQVAVKVMSADLARRDPSLVERFAVEAQAAAKIRHPHIVQMLDHGMTRDGLPWLSMELLEGESLRDRIEPPTQASPYTATGAFLTEQVAAQPVARPLPPSFVLAVLEQVASAVAKAHAAGIVHRDLKPENLFVTDVAGKPFVKVLDFGIAKRVDAASGMTATGQVFGTPAYMSPEQLLSTKKVDQRTDLWALAVIAYEMLTGRLPFSGETSSAIAVAVAMGQFVPATAVEPGLGPAVDAWFARAFAKEPTARFASAPELAQTLAVALGTLAPAPSAPTGKPVARTEFSTPGGPAFGAAPGPSAVVVPGGVQAVTGEPAPVRPGNVPTSPGSRSGWGMATVALGAVVVLCAAGVVGLLVARRSPTGKEPAVAATPTTAAASAGAAAHLDAVARQAVLARCPPGMISIPGGTFRMGDGANSGKVGEVVMPPLCMDRTEVTVAAYNSCVARGLCKAADKGGTCNTGAAERENHPINCVDWSRAKSFCEAMGQRLPTEEEWEYAARGTDGRTFPWGNDAPKDQLCWNGEGNRVGSGKRTSTCPVGAFPAGNSPFGLADMAGNVWEWTSSGDEANRINRGGSWFSVGASYVRAADRDRDAPGDRDGDLGFRCAGPTLP